MFRKSLLPVIALCYALAFFYFGQWKSVFYRSDAWGYYLHLPATLIYQDGGDYSVSIAAWRTYNPSDPDPRADKYGLRPSPTGKTVNKYPVGVALLQSPFFALAHAWCLITRQFPADGFSRPYLLLAGLSTLFYALLGLFFLEKTLRRYFSETVVRWTVGTIAFATNLFFFSTFSVGMAHPYLFFGFALLIWATQRWYESRETKNQVLLHPAIWIGVAAGLIAICRMPEVLAVLIPPLWGLGSLKPRSLVHFWWQRKSQIILAIIVFSIILSPQLAYMKSMSGQWIFNSYQGEHFDWANPQILNGLFNYQNGWLIYTPVMALSLLGIFWLRRFAAAAFWPLMVLLPLHAYIIYSWWCWQYINGFGSRPMVDLYPLLAFPLAALIAAAWHRSWSRWLMSILLFLFVVVNLFQTWQEANGILWSERANAAYFKEVFGKTKLTRPAYIAFETGKQQPDTADIAKIKTLFVNEIKDSLEEAHTRQRWVSAPYGCRCTGEFCMTTGVPTDALSIQPGDWLRLSVKAFMRPEERERRFDHLARLTMEINGPTGQRYGYGTVTVTSKIANHEHTLWYGGKAGEWGEAAFFLQVPPDYQPGGNVKAYIWNGPGQKLFLDDMSLELWRAR